MAKKTFGLILAKLLPFYFIFSMLFSLISLIGGYFLFEQTPLWIIKCLTIIQTGNLVILWIIMFTLNDIWGESIELMYWIMALIANIMNEGGQKNGQNNG